MNRDDLLRELTALDFVAVDLNLYLNTHPMDCEAIQEFNRVIHKAGQLRDMYEKAYGPLTANRSSECPWQWFEDPWPWQSCFNFYLPREECR
jgi:spore coat protein JB